MVRIRDEIREIASDAGLQVRELHPAEIVRIRGRLLERFDSGRSGSALWQRIESGEGFQDREAWRLIDQILDTTVPIVFFDIEREVAMFELFDGTDLVQLLGEMRNEEFYVTDIDAEFIICHNRYDFLIACGSAIAWLDRILRPPE